MNFWDQLGRLHTKPVTDTNLYPTNNAYTYSGYHKVLKQGQIRAMYLPEAMPFSRHPDKSGPAISHDEVTGVCMLSSAHAKVICKYLDENYNQFCNLTGFKPTPFYKLDWLKVIPSLITVLKADNQRHATMDHPEIHPIAFWQQPQYRWFYKRAAGIAPSLWEKFVFVVLRFISIIRWKKDDPNLLLYFSLEHLSQEKNLGIEGFIMERILQRKLLKNYSSIEDMLRHKHKDVKPEYHSVHPWFTKEG